MSGRFYGQASGASTNESGDTMDKILQLLTEQREVMFTTQQQNQSLMMLCDNMSVEVEKLKQEVVTMKESMSSLSSKVEESNSTSNSSKKSKCKLPRDLSVSFNNLSVIYSLVRVNGV